MPEIPDVVQGTPVASDWGNDIRDRTLQRYADATERDALNPLPTPGDQAYLDDSGAVQVWTGSAWETTMPKSGGVFTGQVSHIRPTSDPALVFRNLAIGAEPSAPVTGDLWIDTVTPNGRFLKRYSGTAWDTMMNSGKVRNFWQTTVQVATTQGQVAILDVDISAAGITNWGKVNVNVIGFASNAQSTQRFWSIWSFSLTSLSLRNTPGQSNPASGTAFGRLQITEYW